MGWNPINQGTNSNSNSSGSTLARAVSSDIAVGSLVVVGVTENTLASSGGSMTDDAGNTYTSIVSNALGNSILNGFGQFFYSVAAFQLNAGARITYTKRANDAATAISVVSTVGNTSIPLDSAVTAFATGSSSVPSVTSGIPTSSGELFIGVCSSQGMLSLTVDTGNGWATPPTFVASSGFSSGASVGGGSQINNSTGTKIHAPTLSTSRPWANFIVGFQPDLSLIPLSGVGSLSATAAIAVAAAARFSGIGSLRAAALLNAVIMAAFTGTGSLGASTAQRYATNPARLSGAGSLSVFLNPFFANTVPFAGAGSLSASAVRYAFAAANFGGIGHFCINGTVRPGAFGRTSNVSVSGPGPTNNVVV